MRFNFLIVCLALLLGAENQFIVEARALDYGDGIVDDSIEIAFDSGSCKDKCKKDGKKCLDGVEAAYSDAHAVCRLLDDDGFYPYSDLYYACMAAAGFGSGEDLSDLGTLRSFWRLREQCREIKRACIDNCEEKACAQIREALKKELKRSVRGLIPGPVRAFVP